jgi:hypothetical protein
LGPAARSECFPSHPSAFLLSRVLVCQKHQSLKFRPASTRVTSSDITPSSFRATGPRTSLVSSRPTLSRFPDLHLVTSADITLIPTGRPRPASFRFHPVWVTLSDPAHPTSPVCLGPTDPDPAQSAFPDLLSVGIRLQSYSFPPSPSRESPSCFPLPDPQLRLQPFPRARTRLGSSLSQQSMTATWRACFSGRLRVFLHVWRRTTARARTSLLS